MTKVCIIGFGVLGKGPAILVHLLPVALAAPLWVRCLEGQSDGDTPGWGRWYAGVGAGVAQGPHASPHGHAAAAAAVAPNRSIAAEAARIAGTTKRRGA